MKKIIILLGLIVVSLASYSQSTIRMKTERLGFWTIIGDTMQIVSSDNVVAAGIAVPASSSDSVTVTGCTFTVDGISTNGIKIPPGEATIDIGFKFAELDSVNIACPGSGWVILLIDDN